MDQMDYTIEKKDLSLKQQIFSTLMSLARKLDKEGSSCSGSLTASQYVVVLAIHFSSKGEASMVNIAKRLGTTKQNINQLIPILEKKRYVLKTTNKTNKRAVNIILTDEGLNAMLAYTGINAMILSDVFRDFSESEMETLLHLLQKLHSYDGAVCSDFRKEIMSLFDGDYSDKLLRILDECRKQRVAGGSSVEENYFSA